MSGIAAADTGREADGVVRGYTAGVFDMFHIGHLRILKRASRHCDHLTVGVTTDELSLSRKKKKPVVPWEERAAIVGQVRYVDEVVPQTSMDKVAAWHRHHFHVMFVGDDWRGSPTWIELEKAFAELGVVVHYFPYTPHTSSTSLRVKVFGT